MRDGRREGRAIGRGDNDGVCVRPSGSENAALAADDQANGQRSRHGRIFGPAEPAAVFFGLGSGKRYDVIGVLVFLRHQYRVAQPVWYGHRQNLVKSAFYLDGKRIEPFQPDGKCAINFERQSKLFGPRFIEVTVEKRDQFFIGKIASHCKAPPKLFISTARARASLLMTVPKGMSSASAVSAI